MKLVRTLWTLLAATSLSRLENGEALRNRGQTSMADMRVDRKVTRRVREPATRRLLNDEIMRNEDQDGTDVVTDNFANGDEEVVGDLQVSQLAARRFEEKGPTSSSIERVASPNAPVAEDEVVPEKQADERKGGVRTLRGHHHVKQPITVFGERLVGRNAKVLCRKDGRGVGLRVGGGHAKAFLQRLTRKGGSSRRPPLRTRLSWI